MWACVSICAATQACLDDYDDGHKDPCRCERVVHVLGPTFLLAIVDGESDTPYALHRT